MTMRARNWSRRCLHWVDTEKLAGYPGRCKQEKKDKNRRRWEVRIERQAPDRVLVHVVRIDGPLAALSHHFIFYKQVYSTTAIISSAARATSE